MSPREIELLAEDELRDLTVAAALDKGDSAAQLAFQIGTPRVQESELIVQDYRRRPNPQRRRTARTIGR